MQALALEVDAAGVVDEPVEDGVGDDGIADEFVTAIDGQLLVTMIECVSYRSFMTARTRKS